MSGLFCAALLFASALIAAPLSAHSHAGDSDADARVIEELYEDEVHEFGAMYDDLTVAEKAVVTRMVDYLNEGQRGLFGLFLVRSPQLARERFFILFGSFDEGEFAYAANEFSQRPYEKWGAITALLSEEEVERVRFAFLDDDTVQCLRDEEDRILGSPGFDPSLPPGLPICGEALLAFFSDYSKAAERVTTGYTLHPDEAPWQAQLSLFGESTIFYHSREERTYQRSQFGRELPDWQINHVCGAIYIGERFLLTAAHCIGGLAENKFFDRRRIRLGSTRIDGLHNLVELRAVLVHRDYDPDTLQNDIALIQLESTPNFRRLKKVDLPIRRSWSPPPVDLLLSGWGYRRATESSNLARGLDGQYQDRAISELQGGLIQVLDTLECRDNPHFRRHRLRIYPGQICAGTTTGVDSCRGDSGGPLVDRGSNTLVGIVSGGKGCGLSGVPSIYVDVAYYLPWIENAKRAIRRADDQSKGVYPPR